MDSIEELPFQKDGAMNNPLEDTALQNIVTPVLKNSTLNILKNNNLSIYGDGNLDSSPGLGPKRRMSKKEKDKLFKSFQSNASLNTNEYVRKSHELTYGHILKARKESQEMTI